MEIENFTEYTIQIDELKNSQEIEPLSIRGHKILFILFAAVCLNFTQVRGICKFKNK